MNKNTEKFEEKEIRSECIYDGRVLHVYKDTVSLPDGGTGVREYCKHNGGVCVVPLTDDGCVICVEQYRYAHRRMMLELPAGKLEAGEDRDEAILRELREETGATCKSITYIGAMIPSPALLGEVIYMYVAHGLEFGEQDLDDDEFLRCVKIPLDKLVEDVCNGKILDAKTQIAILRVWKYMNENKK